ncbi:hypothetical protein JDN40_12065 [Rhodomicrobium vannielii ATCC 17100]|uniref:hypothetical protein n=1 Tax=Rhodomicrobium vannielii TaxID=1069 RepID=UPI0019197C1F|nr:hypothetical protein [Rhodomicrobium vannielii]MBJ7534842.1 hypothetical protein [Rhodomicrobium vannielii ATCC 17100]
MRVFVCVLCVVWSATVLAAGTEPDNGTKSAASPATGKASETADKPQAETQQPKIAPNPAPTEAENIFLDRLMRAESGGRQFAKNPLSSALGPYQFIESTFLDVVKRNLPDLAAGKNDFEILALRTDYAVSRTVALLFTRENAAALAEKNQPATPANLRLAFFAGAATALKVLEAEPEERVSGILSDAAVRANPFLAAMTARQLIERSAREAERGGTVTVALSGRSPVSALQKPRIAVRCNLQLASCRKWLALAEARLNARTGPLKTAAKAPQKQP